MTPLNLLFQATWKRIHRPWRLPVRSKDEVAAQWGRYLPYYKRNLKVALPVMLTQAGASLVGLADSVMVGHYSTADLAAVSFSNAIFFTVMVFAMGAIMGLTPLVGIEVGRSQAEHTNRDSHITSLLQNGITFTLLLSLAMMLLLGACIPLLGSFGQDPEVVTAATPYYIYIVISILPFLFFCLQKQFLEGLGNTTVALFLSIFTNLLNILLNYIFIFGHCGFSPMGAAGAGLATLISRLVMPLGFTIVILCRRDWRKYITLFSRSLHSARQIRQLLRIGLPIGGQSLSEVCLFTFSFIIVGWLSKEALAAHHIANQIADFTFMLATGIGAATTIRVSHQLGKGDLHAVRMASNASIHLVLLMNTIGAVFMLTCRQYIPLLFTEDEQVISIASTLIFMAALLQYADGLQAVGAAMLRGITDVKRPMIYAFIAYMLIGLPVGIICMFPLHMGATGIWVGFIAGLICAAIAFHTRFQRLLRHLSAQ